MESEKQCSLCQNGEYVAASNGDYIEQQDFEGEMLHQVNRPADTSRPACKSVEDSANRMIYNLKIAQLKGGGGHYDAACTIYKQLRSSQHRNGCITKTLSDAAGSGADAMAARTQKGSYKASLETTNAHASTQNISSPRNNGKAYHQSTDSKASGDGYSSTMPSPHSLSDNTGEIEDETSVPSAKLLQKVLQKADAIVGGSSSAPAASEGADEVSAEAGDDASLNPAAAAAELEVAPPSSDQDACSVFFARVPPTVPYESILALFQHFGPVKSLNLFRPWASAKTSKGCGIVEYEEAPAALAAMSALHTKYHWTGGETTMVVEWMDPARHRKDRHGSQDDGPMQAYRSSSSASKSSKNLRKKNGKQNFRPCSNLNSMPLPNIMGGSCRIMPGADLASSMSAAAYAAQYPWIIDAAARQACYNALGAATAGVGGIQGLEQVHMDGLVDARFNASGGNLPAQAVSIAPCWGSGIPIAALPAGICGISSTSQDGSCHSWPMSEPLLAMPLNAVQTAAADSTRVANLLQQQQHHAALGGLAARPASVGSHYGCTSQGDLQKQLENLNNQSYLAGISGLGMSGNIATTAGAAAATASAATGVNYHAARLLHAEQQALRSSGSPVPSSGTVLFDCNGSLAANTATTAAAAAAAANLLVPSNNNSSANVYSNANTAPLPRIATRTAVSMQGSEGCSSSPFSICAPDLSPMTAVSGTPTYFQLGGNHALSNLNPGGVAPNMFNMASANVSTSAAAVTGRAAVTGSNCLVQYLMSGQANMPVGGGVGSLLGAEHRWGGM